MTCHVRRKRVLTNPSHPLGPKFLLLLRICACWSFFGFSWFCRDIPDLCFFWLFFFLGLLRGPRLNSQPRAVTMRQGKGTDSGGTVFLQDGADLVLETGADFARNFSALSFKVARLQSEFCTKDFFRATNFLTKNAPKFSLKCLSLCSVGQKKIPGKFPLNFPLNLPNFPAKNQKKITDELLQEHRENFLDGRNRAIQIENR